MRFLWRVWSLLVPSDLREMLSCMFVEQPKPLAHHNHASASLFQSLSNLDRESPYHAKSSWQVLGPPLHLLLKRMRLVCVKVAKKLALSEGNTIEDLAHNLETQLGSHCLHEWLQKAPLEPLRPGDAEMRRRDSGIPRDKYCGMGFIYCPSLSRNAQVEEGLWCLGCEELERDLYDELSGPVSHLNIPGLYREVREKSRVERSEDGFFDHVLRCPGTTKLVPDLARKMKQMQRA